MENGRVKLSPDSPSIGYEKEEEMGILGTPVSGLPKGPDGIHILPGSLRVQSDRQAEVRQLEIEESRAQPPTVGEGESGLDANPHDPHSHYFVPYPEL